MGRLGEGDLQTQAERFQLQENGLKHVSWVLIPPTFTTLLQNGALVSKQGGSTPRTTQNTVWITQDAVGQPEVSPSLPKKQIKSVFNYKLASLIQILAEVGVWTTRARPRVQARCPQQPSATQHLPLTPQGNQSPHPSVALFYTPFFPLTKQLGVFSTEEQTRLTLGFRQASLGAARHRPCPSKSTFHNSSSRRDVPSRSKYQDSEFLVDFSLFV